MLTYEKYQAAFANESERDAFFERAANGVPPGTAMTHALGTNLGPWGDEAELRKDVAAIMACELDTWADENGTDRLGLPVEAIVNNSDFRKAFDVCRKPNRTEIDTVFKNISNPEVVVEAIPHDPAIDQYLTADFVEKLYYGLCEVADKYKREIDGHRDSLARIGVL